MPSKDKNLDLYNGLPSWLKELAESPEKAIEQERLREANLSRSAVNLDDSVISYANTELKLAIAAIDVYSNMEGDQAKEFLYLEKERAADALMTLGRIDDAIDYAQSPERIIEAHLLKYALNRPDDDSCDCSGIEVLAGGNYVELPREFAVRRIFSPVHNRMMNVMKCSKCPHLNVTDVRSEQFMKLESAKNKSDSKTNDSEIFKELAR